jgi:uncharacterized protein YbjT (DUF2867 family)
MTATKTVQRVLVAGGTGGTGRLAVGRLRSLGIPTRILTRDRRHAASGGYRGVLTRQWKPAPMRDEGGADSLGLVEVVEGDALVEEDCRRAVDGCDAIICTMGRGRRSWQGPSVDHEGIINLARAADQAGSRFVLVSALGVGDSWKRQPLFIRALLGWAMGQYRHDKDRSEGFVEASGLAWTILRPGFLHDFQMRSEPVLTVSGHVPGFCGRHALADVAVRCLQTANAKCRALSIADAWCGHFLLGEPFALDVPWAPWDGRVRGWAESPVPAESQKG